MDIYLPIAEVAVNVFALLALGSIVGFLSGMFGVGGGFLLTPLLMLIGIPPGVAVATQANQFLATSITGVFTHWRRGNVDVRMGLAVLVGGMIGSTLGVWIFTILRSLGHIDLVIRLSFVIFLGVVGILMGIETIQALLKRSPRFPRGKQTRGWKDRLPFRIRFRRSRLYISVLLPIGLGVFVGILSAILGVGGGFILVPAMIYILGMPTSVVVGTSLFQSMFVTANVTILQSATNQTVDVLLALLLLVGGVIGAHFGARFSSVLRGEQLRGLLALLVLIVAGKLAYDLIATPADLYTLGGIVRSQ